MSNIDIKKLSDLISLQRIHAAMEYFQGRCHPGNQKLYADAMREVFNAAQKIIDDMQ